MNHLIINENPEILYEDPWILIVHKEREELTVPGRGPGKEDCLMSRTARYGGEVYNIHRLDQPTSGLVIVARTKEVQRNLSMAFEEKRVYKEYEALVKGLVKEVSGSVDLPMRGDRDNRPLQIIDPDKGKKALTKWTVLERGEGWTRLLLLPETGRTHQLRVHMKAVGHPILGDRLYNDDVPGDLMGELKLHARRVVFTHPVTGEKVDVVKNPDF